ncbi:unnamed protein product [Amoebophrya sp. A25]|nr:unnamed protein product [Amoebophrya sp. A25]|eukprot:GSA25T00014097001.1
MSHCVFYSACVVKAFEHLHERRILYRDLKPENLLLDPKGWLKITDMGLAKFTVSRTYTTCGTPDYFAPEIVRSTGHTHAVDWWTLGILIYELLTGAPPFEGHPMERYKKILNGVAKAPFPSKVFTPHAQNLVLSLCAQDPSERLPVRPGGVVQNLYTHPFYDFEKWSKLSAKKLQPPYVPNPKTKLEMFKNVAEPGEVATYPYVDPGTGWDADF